MAFAAVAFLAGCGGGAGGPRLAHSDAAPLISLSHRIGHEGACAQARDIPQLRSKAVALVQTGRVPADLQEPLMSGVNALVVPVCLPRVSVTATTPAVVPAAPRPKPHAPPKHHEHLEHHDKHGKHR